jgi:hypothetical protein
VLLPHPPFVSLRTGCHRPARLPALLLIRRKRQHAPFEQR